MPRPPRRRPPSLATGHVKARRIGKVALSALSAPARGLRVQLMALAQQLGLLGPQPFQMHARRVLGGQPFSLHHQVGPGCVHSALICLQPPEFGIHGVDWVLARGRAERLILCRDRAGRRPGRQTVRPPRSGRSRT